MSGELTDEETKEAMESFGENFWTYIMKHAVVEDNEFREYDAVDPWRPNEPALYHDRKLCKEAEEAFKRGEKKFLHKKPFSRKTVTVKLEIPKDVWNGFVGSKFPLHRG